jgi:uncharacterized peroxidase-related enzyme
VPAFDPVPEEAATGIVKDVFEEMKRLRNLDEVPPIWRMMAHRPEYLKATWERYKAIMLEGSLDLLTKEIIALAVSAANNCDYCVGSHTAAVMRLGLTEAQVVEILSVVDFFSGTNAFASGLRLHWHGP